MENRYAGDVGDFIKLGLLRYLAAEAGPASVALRIGVNWYLAPDETTNGDGGLISYLSPKNPRHASLRACDPALMTILANVVSSERSVMALESAGALPAGSIAYHARLPPGLDIADRRAWHDRALQALGTADVVFADPDNGITESCPLRRMHKYSLVTELADYASRGQSVIAYHHADRSGSAVSQAERRLQLLALGTGLTPVGTVIGRRGNTRFFLICATEAHASRISRSVRAFAKTWTPHVDLVAPRNRSRRCPN